jgi:prevent-host-death family protein
MGISQFKARCLDLIEQLRKNGGEIVLTKRGRPCAVVRPRTRAFRSILGAWKGRVEVVGDLSSPARAKDWEYD